MNDQTPADIKKKNNNLGHSEKPHDNVRGVERTARGGRGGGEHMGSSDAGHSRLRERCLSATTTKTTKRMGMQSPRWDRGICAGASEQSVRKEERYKKKNRVSFVFNPACLPVSALHGKVPDLPRDKV